MTEQELLAKTWFYRFPLPSGAVTSSYHDGTLDEVHTTRVQMMARALREHFGDQPIASAVDLACHQGWFSWQLTEHGVERVTGIEPRDEHVADARAVIAAMGLAERIQIQQCDVHDTTPERFGIHPLVLCFGLIYHLENPIGALRRARALTAPGGLCLVETQVVPGMRGFVDWGNYRFVRPLKGSFGIIDEMAETHAAEASTSGICLAPDTEGLLWIMRNIGFRDVALVPPPENGYEQHLYGKRVMVRAIAA
ncbi:MAG: class I SAM-dependent methyltransferase [Lysobacterales bacterium]